MENQIQEKKQNPMREIFIEKITLSCGGIKDELEKQKKLLGKISGKKVSVRITRKRIPSFNIRPTMEVGVMVTLRGKGGEEVLSRLLSAVENQISKKQITDNHFSFGIKEYIEIPGEKYDREIGMMGLKVTVVFARKGKRVARKKIKRGKLPLKQVVKKQEIIEFMEKNYGSEID
jgi:large subunit ribosomal protein L5